MTCSDSYSLYNTLLGNCLPYTSILLESWLLVSWQRNFMFVCDLCFMTVYTTNQHWIRSWTSWIHPTCSTTVPATYLLIWLSQISFGLQSEKRASILSKYNEMPVLATQSGHPKTADVKIRGWLRFFLGRDEIRLRYIMYNFAQKDDKSKYVLFFSREQWNIILFIFIELGFHKGKLNISLFVELEKATFNDAMSVRPHVTSRLPHKQFFIKLVIWGLFENLSRKFKFDFKSYKNSGYYIYKR
jgi:hypothetical protein